MSLETIISSGLTRPADDRTALVLMGGGARTAYQAGVLQALGRMLKPPQETPKPPRFPFQILVGTSAGALNACYLASRATQGLAAFAQLADFWGTLRSAQVYQLLPGFDIGTPSCQAFHQFIQISIVTQRRLEFTG